MSSPNDRDWQRKLEILEAEVNRESASQNSNNTTKEISTENTDKNWLDLSKNWFDRLPQAGKIAVSVVALWLGFSLLNTFLHLISSLISIAFIGLLLYLGYRFVSNSQE